METKIYYKTPTREIYKKIAQKLLNEGYVWFLENVKVFYSFPEDTCVGIDQNKNIKIGSHDFFKENNYKLIKK